MNNVQMAVAVASVAKEEGYIHIDDRDLSSWTVNNAGEYIAPAGLPWVEQGARLVVCSHFNIHKTAILKGSIHLGMNVKIGPRCTVDNSFLGDSVVLEEGVSVTGCKIGAYTEISADSSIGELSKIGSCVRIFPGVKIGPRCVLENDCRVDHRCVLGQGVRVSEKTRIAQDCVLAPYSVIDFELLPAYTRILETVDIGYYDGYRKILCGVGDGATPATAYVGSSNLWMSLNKAHAYWQNMNPLRQDTVIALKTAVMIARRRGWFID